MVDLSVPSVNRLRAVIIARLTVDTRSLAVFRILAGLLIIADVLLRSRNFHFYYTDDGVVPQSLAEAYTADHAFSVFFYTSNPRLIAALFLLHVLVALFLIVGYQTRLALIVSFLLVVSLDHHNPLVTSYADTLFRLLLFWAIFLPLGERWSVDAVHRERPPRGAVAGLATFAFLVQMVTMYFINGLHKLNSEMWLDGSATPIVMGIDEITFLLGPYVRYLPYELLAAGGVGWFLILLASPLLLVLPGRARYAFASLYFAGHAVFAVTVRIGAFPYVAIAGLVPFLQTQWYRDLQLVARRAGVGEPVQQRLDGVRAVAVTWATRLPHAPGWSPRHRHVRAMGLSAALVIAVIGVLVLPWGAWAADADLVPREPNTAGIADEMFVVVGVDQPSWRIFAPNPPDHDRYYVFAAVDEDGNTYDLYHDRELRYDRPSDALQRQYGTYRERFYMNSVRRGPVRGGPADHLLAWHCDQWRHERGVELEAIEIWDVIEPIDRDTIASPEDRQPEAEQITRYPCGDLPGRAIEAPAIAV